MVKAKTASERPVLGVQPRVEAGKRRAERLRQSGWIPGVVYGEELTPMAIQIPERALIHLLHSKAGEHALVTLKLEDGQRWEKPALVKDVQHDAVDGHVLHVDFHAIALTERIKVKIAVVLKGEPVGVKQDGGILEHFLREIEVECLPTEIPDGVEYDVSAMTIGTTIHVRDLTPPKSAKIIQDPENPVASVQAPREEKVAETAEAVAEPEVLREKKEEGEAEGEKGGEKGGARAAGGARPPGPPGTRAGAGGGGEGRAGEAKGEGSKDKADKKDKGEKKGA